MLVLRRKVGESVMIGDDVEVTVLEIAPQTVALGITGPKSTAVVRKELVPVKPPPPPKQPPKPKRKPQELSRVVRKPTVKKRAG